MTYHINKYKGSPVSKPPSLGGCRFHPIQIRPHQVIRIIADQGRRFFYSQAVNRYASMEIDPRGKVWLIDNYSGKRIFTHNTVWGGKWRGFSHGGTLKDLVKDFRDYIRCTPATLALNNSMTATSGVKHDGCECP